MPRDVLVRQTAWADLPAITAIYGEAVRIGAGSFELKAPDVIEMTSRWGNRVAKKLPHIVATSGDAVVGYAYVSRFRTSAACRSMVEDSIFVASDARGAGVGRALMAELIKLCEQAGFRHIIANIACENLPSVKLHERLGFQKIGIIEGAAFKNGQWIDALMVQRALGEGKVSPPHDG